MADHKAKLSHLVPGDIFHAECPSGASSHLLGGSGHRRKN